MEKSNYQIGVDVGGTFTDIFIVDTVSGTIAIEKVSSTTSNQALGFMEGITNNVSDLTSVGTIVHGTTVGTNALLERKGAKTGLITTEGFGDVLEMRRRDRPKTWGLRGSFTPVINRNNRKEVSERVLADGQVKINLDLEAVKRSTYELIDQGCESCCIFFINGYANKSNEDLAAKMVRKIWPNEFVTTATEILPEIREFERLSTAALNAYLQPIISSYFDSLQIDLIKNGFKGDFLIVQSNGGLMSVQTSKLFPVRTALSGPAAGVIAAKEIANAVNLSNIITCDMGGTSFDVSLINEGTIVTGSQISVDFGMIIRGPMVEITTIGAGGGSIASIDKGGILKVGPESAGSNPGPACYGFGNSLPTVTDANLVLGRINPDRPIGGKLKQLNLIASRNAIEIEIGQKLNMSVEEAAEAILKVANAKMASAIRLVSIEKGHDPSKFSAMPFGGGGALHIGDLIKDIGLSSAIIPRFPGVTSALGCLVADMIHDYVQTVNQFLDDIDVLSLFEKMKTVASKSEKLLKKSGVSFRQVNKVYEFDMLYLGQTHTVTVPIQINDDQARIEKIKKAFDLSYKNIFGRLLTDIPVKVVNYRVTVVGLREHFDMAVFKPLSKKNAVDCILSQRIVYISGNKIKVDVYDRLEIGVGNIIPGPALLEQPDTTIFIDPGLCGEIDKFGNLVIKFDSGKEKND